MFRQIVFKRNSLVMKKGILCLVLIIMNIGTLLSQFDAQFSQYMFYNSSFNPAAVGEGDMIQITGQHRIQWIGMPNGGQTTVFSINSPLKIEKINQGIGLKFLNDKVGQFTNQTAHLQYAYKMKLGVGTLSVGTDLGFVSIGFHGDSVRNISLGSYHDIAGDIQIPKTSVSGIGFDMSLGLFYSTPKYYGGISFLHLNSPTVNWGENIKFKQTGSLFITGGYNWVLPDTKFVIKPSTLIKTNFSSMQLDLSGRVEYDSKYWGGVSYRFQDAVVLMAGINIAGGLSIGYSYDILTSRIATVSSGSHEVLVSYSFEYIFEKMKSKYKSIRIL